MIEISPDTSIGRMHPSVQDLVRDFHRAFALCIAPTPAAPKRQLSLHRQDLMSEEVAELAEASTTGDLAHIAQELADVVYIGYGTALVHGIDLDAVIAEVHRANMSKLGPDGHPERRADGKILKGPSYQAPRHRRRAPPPGLVPRGRYGSGMTAAPASPFPSAPQPLTHSQARHARHPSTPRSLRPLKLLPPRLDASGTGHRNTTPTGRLPKPEPAEVHSPPLLRPRPITTRYTDSAVTDLHGSGAALSANVSDRSPPP
ncbi:MazG nucleotide pyrophosphohydrolase domain-containing protein [Streptomyces sp. SCSIO 30461]|uniref:MazG nucleotide pyrophosphohydrolase domain-containing protein n=1 Tax=Streptomyces sp. SCSIO 30461 TaxID=3118085 RepID=UPI0030CBA55E